MDEKLWDSSGLSLAIPPGFSPAAWSAAGLALACLLLCNRYAALAGIGGGSFLINLGLSSDQYHHINLQNIQMPEMDGYDATRMIRKHPPWQHIPILAMTANAMDNDIRKCKACGMQGHIAKPIHEEKMLTSILQHIQGSAE